MPDIIAHQLLTSMSKWPVYCGGLFLVVLFCVNVIFYIPFKIHPMKETCNESIRELSVELEVNRNNETYIWTNETIYDQEKFWEKENRTYGCPCRKNPCIRKCCKVNAIFNKEGHCVNSDMNNTLEVFQDNIPVYNKTIFTNFLRNISVGRNHFRVIPGCPYFKILDVHNLESLVFVFEDGRVWNKFYNDYFNQSRYCLDIMRDAGKFSSKPVPMVIAMCRSTQEQLEEHSAAMSRRSTLRHTIQTVCYVIYIVTFLVFAIQPSIRRGYGRWLMCYLAARLLKVVNILFYFGIQNSHPKTCFFIVTIIQYSELASQAWHVVIFYHIWIALRNDYTSDLGPACIYNNKRFMFFSAVAWGVPVGLLVVVTVLEFAFISDEGIPYIHCWGNNRAARHIYLTLPHMVTDLVILFLCLDILRRIDNYRQDAATLPPNNIRHYNAKEIEWSCTYVKVSIMTSAYLLLMSVLMLIDRVVHVVDFIYYTADALDRMRGLEVFLIFVCRRELLVSLQEKMVKCWVYVRRRIQQRAEGDSREWFELSS